MSTIADRLARAMGAPRRLAWHERHRHRFLHEYNEMKARADAELYAVDGRLTWSGTLSLGGNAITWAIAYHRAHPSVAPTVFVLDPPAVRAALGADTRGRVRVLTQGWHSGLMALDMWRWLKARVDALAGTARINMEDD